MAVCSVKVGNIKVKTFENIGLNPTKNFQQGHIHKICKIVFRRINYIKNTVEMTLYQNYDVFY